MSTTPLESLGLQLERLGARTHLIRQPVPSLARPGFLTALPPVLPGYNGREIGVVALLTPEEDAILRMHRAVWRSWSDDLAQEIRDRLRLMEPQE